MRIINANGLAEISKQYGLESLNIVRVWWNDVPYLYGDMDNLDYGVQGKLMELSGIEDSVLLSGTTSTSVTVKLDDSDGEIKSILNYNDVHKKSVQILQWFAGRPLEDSFVLFDGQINTPIEWDEGQRTFTFAVVSLIENLELGFSFEDGLFPGIPSNLIGKMWPLVFGSVLKVPALQLTESPSGILGEGFAVVNHAQYELEINALLASIKQCNDLARLYYLAHIDIQRVGSTYHNDSHTVSEIVIGEPDNIDTYNQYLSQAAQALQQSYNYSAEVQQLSFQLHLLILDYEEKQGFERSSVLFASQNFPRGVELIAEINGTRFTVQFEGQQMIIRGVVPDDQVLPGSVYVSDSQENNIMRTHTLTAQTEKFKWFDGGARINIINQPMYYIAAFGRVTINGVFGKTRGITTRIPENYYEISYQGFTNELAMTAYCTLIRFNVPLTSVKDALGANIWEGDQIWCDITGEVAGNYGDIVRYCTNVFSDLLIDNTSLELVQTYIANQPMNFMFDQRMGTLDFLKELSFQARVSIWVNDHTLFFRFLPVESTPIETITLADIAEETLVITCTETESLVTKLVGEWKFDYSQPESNRVIARTNILKYGLKEESVDYFAYSNVDSVNLSIAFWSIRMGNSWKLIRFKTFMHKLAIEANDPIAVDLPFACDVTVTGIVERAVYDSGSNLIDIEVWLPVRWGEMLPFIQAYPGLQNLYGDANDIEAQTGNPFQNVDGGNFATIAQAAMLPPAPPYHPIRDYSLAGPPLAGAGGLPAGYGGVGGYLNLANGVPVNYDRPRTIGKANDTKINIVKDDPGLDVVTDLSPIVDIGTIVGLVDGTEKDYYVDIEPTVPAVPPIPPAKPKIETSIDLGIITRRDEKPRRVIATQMSLNPDYVLTAGTPVVLVRKGSKYYMQAPVWAAE